MRTEFSNSKTSLDVSFHFWRGIFFVTVFHNLILMCLDMVCFLLGVPWASWIFYHERFCAMLLLRRFSRVQLFVTLWAVACQIPVSMGFSRRQSWSGCPSRRSSQPRDWTLVFYISCLGRLVLYHSHPGIWIRLFILFWNLF